ncbi:hypothetical protein CEXT_48311 [Caerostris extrusa]|uniref:Uncharacterized protein n=1 Tax=Caerostris extrusa TaxID=172846 RepID=A0AAV4N4K0_CAEEX|nr:hypothetical protein CEXT_48311 [Caerostris extrusa]
MFFKKFNSGKNDYHDCNCDLSVCGRAIEVPLIITIDSNCDCVHWNSIPEDSFDEIQKVPLRNKSFQLCGVISRCGFKNSFFPSDSEPWGKKFRNLIQKMSIIVNEMYVSLPSGTARGRQKAVGPLFITVSESLSIEYFPFVGCPASVPVPITPHLDRSPAPLLIPYHPYPFSVQ